MNFKKYAKIMGIVAATTALVISIAKDKKEKKEYENK